MDLDELQQIVGEWGEDTFPDATHNSIMEHFGEEAIELHNAVQLGGLFGHPIAEEAADCLLLLMHIGHRLGFSLFDEAKKKFAVNQQRTWHAVESGYSKHDEVPASLERQ